MMPFSKYCRTSNKYCKHFSGEKHAGTHTYRCEEEEFKTNLSGWPTKIINIEIPSTRGEIDDTFAFASELFCYAAYGPNCLLYLLLAGFDAYPSFSEIPEANLSGMECGLPTQLSFSAREIADGTFFKAIEDYDPDSKRLLYQLEK
jgi:phospholipid:diacylglycerol acyltransferase